MEPGSHPHLLWTITKNADVGTIDEQKITYCLNELIKDNDWVKIHKIYPHLNTTNKHTLANQLPYPLEYSPEEQLALLLIEDNILTDLNYNTVTLLIAHFKTRKDERALLALKRRAAGGNQTAVNEIIANNLPITDSDWCQLLTKYNPVGGKNHKNILIRLANLNEHSANQLLNNLPNREYRTIQHYLHRTGGTLLLTLAAYRAEEQIQTQINNLNTLMGQDLINFLIAYNHLIQKNYKNRKWAKNILQKCQNKRGELHTQHLQAQHLISAISGQDSFTIHKPGQGIDETINVSNKDLTWWVSWVEQLKEGNCWENKNIINTYIKQSPDTISAEILSALVKQLPETAGLLDDNAQLLAKSMNYTQTLRTVTWPKEGLAAHVGENFLQTLWNHSKNKQQLGTRWYFTVCKYDLKTIKKIPAEAIKGAAGDETEDIQIALRAYLELYDELDSAGQTHYDLLWPLWTKTVGQLLTLTKTLAAR